MLVGTKTRIRELFIELFAPLAALAMCVNMYPGNVHPKLIAHKARELAEELFREEKDDATDSNDQVLVSCHPLFRGKLAGVRSRQEIREG